MMESDGQKTEASFGFRNENDNIGYQGAVLKDHEIKVEPNEEFDVKNDLWWSCHASVNISDVKTELGNDNFIKDEPFSPRDNVKFEEDTTFHAKYSSKLETQDRCDTLNDVKCRSINDIADAECCTQCGFLMVTGENFKLHLKTHHSLFDFNCEHCFFGADSKERMVKHMRAMHKVRYPRYRRTRDTAYRDERHSEKPFSCSRCRFRADSKSRVDRHISEVHSGRKPYECPRCDFKTAHKSQVALHLRAVHEKKKPHACPHCEYTAAWKGHVNRHIRSVHKGEKPFCCPFCDYRATRKRLMGFHVYNVHKVDKKY